MFNKKQKEIPQEEVTEKVTPVVTKKVSKEPVLGTILLAMLIVIVCLGLFGAGFGAFVLWKKQVAQNEAPSINGLADQPMNTVPQKDKVLTDSATTPTEDVDITKQAQALDVTVMNGGGAKGVATEVANLLKTKGFSKVTVGNTVGDFTGTVVYYQKGKEKEASVVKEQLPAKYGTITTKEAETSNKETTTATITIIFGK